MSDRDKIKLLPPDDVDEDELDEDEEEEYDEDDWESEDDDEIEVDTDQFFAQLILFSCFRKIAKLPNPDRDQIFDEVFALYEEEELTEQQDQVIELLLHLQAEESPINVHTALTTLNKYDREVMLTLLQQFSDDMNDD